MASATCLPVPGVSHYVRVGQHGEGTGVRMSGPLKRRSYGSLFLAAGLVGALSVVPQLTDQRAASAAGTTADAAVAPTSFHPYGPRRLIDTRTTCIGIPECHQPVASGNTVTIQLPTYLPELQDATSLVLDVFAIQPTAGGHLTVFPSGAARPDTSNVNFAPGQMVSNL